MAANLCTLSWAVAPRERPRERVHGEVTAVSDQDLDGMILARVTITRVMSGDDIVDHVLAATADGDELGLAEALGMMRLAEDTLIRARERDE